MRDFLSVFLFMRPFDRTTTPAVDCCQDLQGWGCRTGPETRGCYSYMLSFQVKLVLCRLKNDTFAIGSRNLSPPLKVSRRRRVNEGVAWGSISDKCPVTHPWCCRTAQKLFILEQFFKNIKTYFIFNF